MILFSHESSDVFETLGPCVLALIRTPVVAFAPDGESVAMLFAPGPVVGTATYDDYRGVYGILGADPPHVRLAMVLETPVLGRNLERNYCIAKHPARCGEGLRWAVTTALAGFALDHTLLDAGVRVERDGELVENRTIRAEGGALLAQAIVRFAEDVSREGLLECSDLRVTLKPSYPRSLLPRDARSP